MQSIAYPIARGSEGPNSRYRSVMSPISRLATPDGTLFYSGELRPAEFPFMTDQSSRADGARVLADLHALRAIGAYKTGVHKPTFSEPHLASLAWLVQRLPEAGLTGEIDGIGNILGTSTKPGPKLLAGSHLESQNHAGWLDGPLGVVYALEAARSHQSRSERKRRGRSGVMVRRGRSFRKLPRQPLLCRRRHRRRYRRGARPQQRQEHA